MVTPDISVGPEVCPRQISQAALQEWLQHHFSIFEEETSILFCFRSQNAEKQFFPLMGYVKNEDGSWSYQIFALNPWLKSLAPYFPGGEASLIATLTSEIVHFHEVAKKLIS